MNEKKITEFRGQKIGIIFQQFHLIPNMSAIANVALPLQIAKQKNFQDKALKMLTSVGLGDRVNHLPAELSGGECQRVAIARAFAIEPEILLADEPSGNLDAKTGEKVMNLLFEEVVSRKMSLILVTHDLELAKRCQSIYKLGDGNLTKFEL